VPRLVDGRGFWPSVPVEDFPWLGPDPFLHGFAALFQSLTNFESWLHLVKGGKVGI
jgi:hypothetical protein